ERRGIAVGARVVVHNDRGAFTAVARVEDGIRPGVVGAVDLVGEVCRGWRQCEPDYITTRDRLGTRASVLRQSGGGWAGGLSGRLANPLRRMHVVIPPTSRRRRRAPAISCERIALSREGTDRADR